MPSEGEYTGIPNSSGDSDATYDALESAWARRLLNSAGRSFTTIIPNEAGPKASERVSKETVPISTLEKQYMRRGGTC